MIAIMCPKILPTRGVLFLFALALGPAARADDCAQALRRFLAPMPNPAFRPVDAAWIADQLAKVPTSPGPLSDLSDALPESYRALGRLPTHADAGARRAAIAQVPIADLMTAPGHRILRKPAQIAALKGVIQRENGANFAHDPVLLNVITAGDGKILSVDIWNAHHRLVAYIEAGGYSKIGDIPARNLRILVNGMPEHGHKWGHMIPAAGVDLPGLRGQYRVADAGEDPGTIVLDGARSNFELGSRLTLGHLARVMRERRGPRIGIFFGTFDPVHEGHIDVARRAADEFGLHEVVLVANANPAHKPNATSLEHRTRMLALRVGKDDKLNAYVGDSGAWVDGFGKDVFFKHMEQIYGTRELFEIYGGDSYEKLFNLGQIRPREVKYVVFKRDMQSASTVVPPELQSSVLMSDAEFPARSSTQVRNALRVGLPIAPDLMDPDLVRYIREHRLYGAGR